LLILTRRVGESIVIGEDIFCTILKNKDGQISLGYDAPPSTIINRYELHSRIHQQLRENRADSRELKSGETVIERLTTNLKKDSEQALH